MTTERLTQLRDNLIILRDCTNDYRASVLANWAVVACEGDNVPLLDLAVLADALGISPDAKGELG